ncbi:MAG: helix-turn-helix transcriptional regulator, partial [Burkholderiaceae bacterium]|nr:helix-turn-helix transcriptional regulator [Burkholderiaceae bacterium]
MTEDPMQATLRFGPDGRFQIQPLERRLLVDGEPVALGGRAFDLLLVLSAQPGTLLTKHQLLDAVWPGVVVEENNLAAQISALRKVLGGEVIATIPGRGYRFAARFAARQDGAAPKPAQAASSPPARPPAEARLKTNLPPELPQLLGREDDLCALGTMIERHALVTVVGAGGMGKSLLTQHLLDARRSAYPHGVCWVELGSETDPALLPGAVAAALGVQLGGSDALAGLCSAVAPLQVLVALDNIEQVLDGVAHMAAALLAEAPGLRLVVTSQAPLKLGTERVYRIGPLAVPQNPLPAADALSYSAVALFTERARCADSRFALTDANAPAVIELCRALDGLALAIELAAARAPMLGVQRLAASMGDRLKLLTTSRNRAAPQRQQTLRAAMAWSHGFLDERERAVFRRLAVFAGSGSLSMIQQVVADPTGEGELDEWAVLDALALLVDRSLVTALVPDGTAEPRYRLQDSPRVYALERLKEAGEEEALRRRHMQAVAAFCDAAWHRVFSGDVGWQDWLLAFQPDADNAREALSQAVSQAMSQTTTRRDRVAALQIGATCLHASYDMPAAQQLALAEQCTAQIDESVPPSLQMRIRIRIALTMVGIRPALALKAARTAWSLDPPGAQPADDRLLRFLRYLAACSVAMAVGRNAGDTLEQQAALAQARALEDPRWPPQRRVWRARAEFTAADAASPDAQRLGRDALALEIASGSRGYHTRSDLIAVELAANDAQAATQTGEALLAELQGGRNERALACAQIHLAAAWMALGNLPRARMLAQAVWPQSLVFDLQPSGAEHLALLAALEARPRAAARLTGYADAAYGARDEPRHPNETTARTHA